MPREARSTVPCISAVLAAFDLGGLSVRRRGATPQAALRRVVEVQRQLEQARRGIRQRIARLASSARNP